MALVCFERGVAPAHRLYAQGYPVDTANGSPLRQRFCKNCALTLPPDSEPAPTPPKIADVDKAAPGGLR
jgi:hypothetical protein